MLVKKVAIDGPESTGKSELAQHLALHFNAGYVDEAARNYLHELGRDYRQSDLLEIATLQCKAEDETSRHHDLLFCDTTLLVIKVWSEFKYGVCDEKILKEYHKRKYDLHILTDIDLPWQSDPLREHPHQRRELFNIYHQELKKSGAIYGIVSGLDEARAESAILLCNQHLTLL